MQELVSVIVLNWNGRQYLEPCLKALQAQTYPNFEVVLVENGSTDGSADFVRQKFGEWLEGGGLNLLELDRNTGFSGGNLAGLEHASPAARYIATLNNDTVAEPGWLEALVKSLEARPAGERWGSACGPMIFASAPDKIASAGIEVRKNGLALDRRTGETMGEGESEQEIFGPCAGAALYKREALEEVGFFDPAFFAYLEDADLAWRLRLAGWRSLYVPGAVVQHSYSGTGKQGSPFKSFQLGRNRLWVIIKNMPGLLLLKNLPRIFFYDIAASAYNLLVRRDPHPLRGRLAALHPRHWRRLRQQRREIQARRKISNAALESWLESNYTLRSNLELRETVDTLALDQPEARK